MGRPPCCDKSNVKRGLWTEEEDAKILAYVADHGPGNWTAIPKKAGWDRSSLNYFSVLSFSSSFPIAWIFHEVMWWTSTSDFFFFYYMDFEGLKRCGKSCRLRWTNYLRPDLRHESFTQEEEELIVTLHAQLGSRCHLSSLFFFLFCVL